MLDFYRKENMKIDQNLFNHFLLSLGPHIDPGFGVKLTVGSQRSSSFRKVTHTRFSGLKNNTKWDAFSQTKTSLKKYDLVWFL
jgi:hypothetical protein